MDRTEFAQRLQAASVAARDFARTFVLETLPDEMLFRVRLNQSYDGNPLHPDERVFPEDSALNLSERLHRCTDTEAIDLIWRDGQFPEWVDIAVVAETGSQTIMGMRCCGRFTLNDQLLYHVREGYPPFHAVGPAFPPGYQTGQTFSIYSRCEAQISADIDALKPHRDKVWSLDLRGPACDDLTLNTLPQFPAMELLDLTFKASNGSGLSALDRQPKLRVLKLFALQTPPLDLERLPRLPLLNTLMAHNPSSFAIDFGDRLPRLPSLNDLDLQSDGVLRLDGRLPASMWAVRLTGKDIAGTLRCCEKVEHLSLHFPEGEEAFLADFLRHTEGVMFLRLSWTPISDTFAKDLLNRWPLDYLELSGTKVSAECVTELKQLHPKLRIFCRPNSRDGGPTSTP